jgi:hypothetical protein
MMVGFDTMNNWNATIDTGNEKICINVSGKLCRLQYNTACENHQSMFTDQQKPKKKSIEFWNSLHQSSLSDNQMPTTVGSRNNDIISGTKVY